MSADARGKRTLGFVSRLLLSDPLDEVLIRSANACRDTFDEHALAMGGSRVPAIKVRQCATTIESSFGQSTVLNGLVEERRVTVKYPSGKIADEISKVGLMLVVTPELADSPATAGLSINKKTAK